MGSSEYERTSRLCAQLQEIDLFKRLRESMPSFQLQEVSSWTKLWEQDMGLEVKLQGLMHRRLSDASPESSLFYRG